MNLTFALRNLMKRPFLNLIKVVGLSIAFSGFLLIFLFLKNELSYDRFFSKADHIYRFTVTASADESERHFARVNDTRYIPEMAAYFSEVENYVRLAPIRGGVLKYNDNFIRINEALECDSTFFQVFEAELSRGNPATVLNERASMVVSEAFAARVFGNEDPVGKVLELPAGQFYGTNQSFTIKGVMKAWPPNCHFHPELITSPTDRSVFGGWAWTYFLLKPDAGTDRLISGFHDFYAAHVQSDSEGKIPVAHFQPITDIHLHSAKLREIEPTGNMNAVYSLSIAAAILLLIALANYANLNLGMAGYSEKFIHVSRVCGSTNRGVMQYFLSENALLVLTSLVFSFILSVAANRLVQHQYGLDLMADKARIIALVSLSLFLLGMVAGNFPVMRHLSVDYTGLKNKFSTFSGRGKVISRGIIVLQYTISIALIVSVIVVGRQTRYALESGLGAAGNLICFEDVHTDIQAKFELFKAELLRNSSVESVSAMMDPPGGEANDMFMFSMEGYIPDPDNPMDSYIGILPCDYSFADLFHLRFMAGRSFSPVSNDHETSGEYIINASAMRRLHYTDPQQIVGKAFALNTQMQDVVLPTGKIIGVVEDFHLSNLKKKVEPLVLFKMRNLWLINFMVSPREGMEDKAITDIRNVWTRLFPEYPFEYSYVGAMYRSVYKTELLQARLMSIFTLVALLVCAMGMLGLTLMTLQRKVKEIGIRKIHGAGISDIVIMLNRDLVRWVLLSFVLSIPAAFWFMTRWLGNFAYKTSLDWWIFALAGSIALVITLLTVSVRSYRAANRNPVEALRYE